MSLEDQIAALNVTVQHLNQAMQTLTAVLRKDAPLTSIEDAKVAADQTKPNGAAATTGELGKQEIDPEKEKEARKITDAVGITTPASELGKQGVTDHITDEPQVTLPELGARLAEIANKYGAVAQDAIKGIVLETGGTQALSQVDPVVLPIIAKKVEEWVAEQPA